MENNYFYDLPEYLQQMIYEKEHKMKMQDVFEEFEEKEHKIVKGSLMNYWIFWSVLYCAEENGDDYTRNLVGKDLWDFYEDGRKEMDWSQPNNNNNITIVSASEDEEEESETEEEIFEFNEEESDDENPFPECDECGDWGNGYGISLYQKIGHWYCAGCIEIMDIQKLLSINNEVV